MNAKPCGVRIASLTSPSFSSNAAGRPPAPCRYRRSARPAGRGPTRRTVRPCARATVSKSDGVFSCAAISFGELLRLGPAPAPTSADPRSARALRRAASSCAGCLSMHLDDVVPELRLHQIADLARLQRERRLVELRHHLPLAEVSRGRRPSPCSRRLPNTSSRAPRNSRPPFALARRSSACFFTAASSLPSVLSRMWLARTCSGVEYCWSCRCRTRSICCPVTVDLLRGSLPGRA